MCRITYQLDVDWFLSELEPHLGQGGNMTHRAVPVSDLVGARATSPWAICSRGSLLTVHS